MEYGIQLKKIKLSDFSGLNEFICNNYAENRYYKKHDIKNGTTFFSEGQKKIYSNDILTGFCYSFLATAGKGKSVPIQAIMESMFIGLHETEGNTLHCVIYLEETNCDFNIIESVFDEYKKICRVNNYTECIFTFVLKEKNNTKLFDSLLEIPNTKEKKVLYSKEETRLHFRSYSWTNDDYQQPEVMKYPHKKIARICAVQLRNKFTGNIEEFEKQARYFTELAKSYKCDFVLFPEYCYMPYNMDASPEDNLRNVESAVNKTFTDIFTTIAGELRINIITGTVPAVADGKFYGSSFIFRKDGTYGKQNKIHITKTEKNLIPLNGGNMLRVFDTEAGKISIVPGYDIEFPEVVREAALNEATIIFNPYFSGNEKDYLKMHYSAIARCIENQIYIVSAGLSGTFVTMGMDDLYAKSAFYTPLDYVFAGNGVAADAEEGKEMVVMYDLNLDLLKRNRRFGSSSNWNDKRTELYPINWKKEELGDK